MSWIKRKGGRRTVENQNKCTTICFPEMQRALTFVGMRSRLKLKYEKKKTWGRKMLR